MLSGTSNSKKTYIGHDFNLKQRYKDGTNLLT